MTGRTCPTCGRRRYLGEPHACGTPPTRHVARTPNPFPLINPTPPPVQPSWVRTTIRRLTRGFTGRPRA